MFRQLLNKMKTDPGDALQASPNQPIDRKTILMGSGASIAAIMLGGTGAAFGSAIAPGIGTVAGGLIGAGVGAPLGAGIGRSVGEFYDNKEKKNKAAEKHKIATQNEIRKEAEIKTHEELEKMALLAEFYINNLQQKGFKLEENIYSITNSLNALVRNKVLTSAEAGIFHHVFLSHIVDHATKEGLISQKQFSEVENNLMLYIKSRKNEVFLELLHARPKQKEMHDVTTNLLNDISASRKKPTSSINSIESLVACYHAKPLSYIERLRDNTLEGEKEEEIAFEMPSPYEAQKLFTIQQEILFYEKLLQNARELSLRPEVQSHPSEKRTVLASAKIKG